MQYLAYNGYTQTFALFNDEVAANTFRDHQSACGLMTAVVPVQTYASAADAIAHCKPLDTGSMLSRVNPRAGFKRGELNAPVAARGTGKSMRDIAQGLDYSDVIDTLQDGE